MNRQIKAAHRFRNAEMARLNHALCIDDMQRAEKIGNVCMAHAKRLQAKYWARRMVVKVKGPIYTIRVDPETGSWTFAQEFKS